MKRTRTRVRFVVCVKNKGYEASLELCKLYRLVPDPVAEQRGYLRVLMKAEKTMAIAQTAFALSRYQSRWRGRLLRRRRSNGSPNHALQQPRFARH